MLGFLAAAAVELGSGQSFFAQLEASGSQPSALWAFLLLATASLVPILRVRVQSLGLLSRIPPAGPGFCTRQLVCGPAAITTKLPL